MVKVVPPLKIEMDQILRQINDMHQAYNLYFQGFDKDPPRVKRTDLNAKMQDIRGKIQAKPVASLSFQFQQLDSRFNLYRNRWDKKLSEIENGAYIIPRQKEVRK